MVGLVTNLKACKVCKEGMVEDECHFLFTCSAYSAIRSRYVDILKGSDNLSVILKTPPRRLSSYAYALFTHRDFVLQCMNTSFQEGDTYHEQMYTLVPQVKIGQFMDDKNSNSKFILPHSCILLSSKQTKSQQTSFYRNISTIVQTLVIGQDRLGGLSHV